ncbi:hypothetical protein [Aquimarina brevivitae]|uniref:DNA primase n=1 Tax=Aquimarina brevivitae TaxID=323412 RepID=A0A4Q7PI44_9FLAO|nr:hypothetical protein [Aquimarina brevivitae]RZT00264.1 hypothetical protein EV197_1500 [Aquimarina brevivitae]
MRRVIVDYKKLNKDILNMLVEKFPDGYEDRDIITFKNQFNETIEAVEVRTEDTCYLVKISKRLADTMENWDDDDDDNDSSDMEVSSPEPSEEMDEDDD